MKLKNILLILLCAVLLAAGPALPARAAAPAEIAELREGILDWQLRENGVESVQEWLDGPLSEKPETAAWILLALSSWEGEDCDFSSCAAALESYVQEEEPTRDSVRQKLSLAFLAAGCRSSFAEEAARDCLGQQGIMSWINGLHLLNNGLPGPMSAGEAAGKLLELRLPDGGWAVVGENADVDVTAMALQALAPRRDDPAVAAAIEEALALLSRRQLPSGGFMSCGAENPESAVQVIVALRALGLDPLTEPDFLKNGCSAWDSILAFRLPDGSFSHEIGGKTNPLATVQVFYGCSAQLGEGSLYLFEEPTLEADKLGPGPGWQLWASLAVGVLALLACGYFLWRRKKSWKNYAFVLLAAAGLIALFFSLDVQRTEDYYKAGAKDGPMMETRLSISCETVAGRAKHIPRDGQILPETVISLPEGSTAYEQLVDAVREYGIHMEKEEGVMGSIYVAGLGNLYEFDFGDLSGWMFCVNGEFADVGCGEYVLKPGDRVQWLYTTDLGHDLGYDPPEGWDKEGSGK